MPRSRHVSLFVFSALLIACASAALADETRSSEAMDAKANAAKPIVLRDYLVLPPPGVYRREPLHRDPLDAQLAHGTFDAPTADSTLTAADGQILRWMPVSADEKGLLRHVALAGGYAFAEVESPTRQPMLLQAQGHAVVYVNGVPRTGDPYETGWLRVPVELRAGKNTLLFHVGRRQLRARLVPPRKPVALDMADATLPDVLRDSDQPVWAALVILNATDKPLQALTIEARRAGAEPLRTELGNVLPFGLRKVGFQIPTGGQAFDALRVTVRLLQQNGDDERLLDEVQLPLRVRAPSELHVRTFVSEIDGSVQAYAVQPAEGSASPDSGLILSLHGAGVDALSQAANYSAKPWAHVVAPSNRRPYGFDWEDWGRIDALEALADAQKQLGSDPRRVYLTGHSMGGHGAWHLGALYPDRFAALGPSAGWCNFWTYGQPRPDTSTDMLALLARGTSTSDPLRLMQNLAAPGVYVLHGQEDETVPVAQSRLMRGQLALFHTNFAYHEKPAAGHWWGESACDWPPMMDFFQHQSLPEAEEVAHVDFATTNPGIASRCHWLTIEAQQEPFVPSRVTLELDRHQRHFTGRTENVVRLSLDLSTLPPNRPLHVTLDGQQIETIAWPGRAQRLWLSRHDDRWHVRPQPSADRKGPHRYGPFKEAFTNRVLFVYGTRGSEEENAWALAKARYDAETFYYRGNASIDVLADVAFDPDEHPDRNVILYGNADTNAAWDDLLADSPVQVRRGVVEIGERPETGDQLATLFLQPRPASDTALVGVVAGTGIAGMRATDRLRYFISGIAYPDLLLFSVDALDAAGPDDLRALGYFGLGWDLEEAEILWRDLAL